jgi:ABC-type transporter Mla subunit MlaD
MNNHEEVVNRVKYMIPLMKNLVRNDMAISLLADGQVVHIDQAENFKMNSKIGDPIPGDDPASEVFRTGRIKEYSISEEVFGEPVFGNLVPIIDKDTKEVVAVVASAFSVKRQQKIESATANLSTSLEQTGESVEDFADNMQNLAHSLNEIQQVSQLIEDKVNEVSSLISTIQGSASRSNILALNASIEAARAGEAGRGFTVVAQEMGKLAQVSGDMATKISTTINDMIKNIALIAGSIQSANEVATTGASTIEEITATLQSITAESETLAGMAKES